MALFPTILCAQGSLSDQLPEKLIPNIGVVIDAALEQSSVMYDRELVETIAQGQRIVRSAASRPSFRASLSYNQEEEQNAKSGFEERLVYSVTLRKSLYHWGALKANNKIGALLYEIEILNTKTAAEGVYAGVRKRYMDLVLAKVQRALDEQELELKRRELNEQKERSLDGLVSSAQLAGIEVSIKRLELTRLRSRSSWEEKLVGFSDYTGLAVEELTGYVGDEIPLFEPLAPEAIRALAPLLKSSLFQDESIARKERSIEVSKKQLEIASVTLKPKLDVRIGMTQNARDLNGLRREQEYLYAGVSANWSIFDGFRTKGLKMEALARLQRNETSKRQLERQLERAYSKALVALEVASLTMSLKEQELRGNIGGFGYQKDEYESGRISEAQLARIQQKVERVSYAAQRARVVYLNALSKLSTMVGE